MPIAAAAVLTALGAGAVNVGLRALSRIPELFRAGRSSSLVEFTREVRVEPIVLMDSQCVFMNETPEVMQSLASIYTGYYLQAAALSMNIGGVSVKRLLDPLNPSRSALDNAVDFAAGVAKGPLTTTLQGASERWFPAMESLDSGLPTPRKRQIAMEGLFPDLDGLFTDEKTTLDPKFVKDLQAEYAANREKYNHKDAMDLLEQRLKQKGLELDAAKFDQLRNSTEIGFGRDALTTVKELSNLSVGKLFNVEVAANGQSRQIPVSVRLMVNQVPTKSLVHMLAGTSSDTTIKERWRGIQSGRLEYIKDGIFARDLIDAHRKRLLEDPDGTVAQILSRKRQNQLAALFSGSMSVATASNIAILSANAATELEAEMRGRLRDYKVRQKVFESTSLMLIAVIDPKWDRITIYHHGLTEFTQITSRDLKSSNKGAGPDVSDILKAYMVGSTPSL